MQLPTLEFSIEFGHAGVARLRLLAQGALKNGGEIATQTCRQLRHVFKHCTNLRTGLHSGERSFTAEQSAGQCGESINIGRRTASFTAHLLRCSKCQRVADAGRAGIGLQRLSDAKIQQYDAAIAVDEDIGRLDIPMQHQLRVRIGNDVGHLAQQPYSIAQRELPRIGVHIDWLAHDALDDKVRRTILKHAAIYYRRQSGML
ncbi:MAG: hypothetical protein ABI127_09770 [Dokdonella sp.]